MMELPSGAVGGTEVRPSLSDSSVQGSVVPTSNQSRALILTHQLADLAASQPIQGKQKRQKKANLEIEKKTWTTPVVHLSWLDIILVFVVLVIGVGIIVAIK